MLSVAEAVAAVTAPFRPLPAEVVSLGEALGRTLAADVVARRTQPPVDVSAMDGYAVRAADVATVPVNLVVIGESAAGHAFATRVEAGQAVRISTGAALPAGADTIVIQEDTLHTGDTVTVTAAATPARWIRRAGLDFAAGDMLLRAGRRLGPFDIALAAAMNVPWLAVRQRPRVAIVATGDEVVMPGEPLGPTQITSANSLCLASVVTAAGGVPLNLGIAGDEAAALAGRLAAARGADLLVTIGGVSVGDHDLVAKVLAAAGSPPTFHKVAMRPGKPLLFGRIGEVPVLGLPGNPVSVGVTSVIFLRPVLMTMLGRDPTPRRQSARLGRPLAANDARQDYLRATLATDDAGEAVVTPFAAQDSSLLSLLSRADCLVVRPPRAPPAAAGDHVDIVLLEESGLAP